MKKGGIEADMIETDFEWGTEYKICVRKENQEVNWFGRTWFAPFLLLPIKIYKKPVI